MNAIAEAEKRVEAARKYLRNIKTRLPAIGENMPGNSPADIERHVQAATHKLAAEEAELNRLRHSSGKI